MKIAVIGPSYPFKGGIAQYTTELYRKLSTRHETLFISFKRQYPNWLYPGQGDRDLDNTQLKESGSRPVIDSLNPLSWYRAVREIAAFGPDIVILPWWVMFWAPQFIFISWGIKRRVKSVRLVFLCHNVIAHEPSRLSSLLTRVTLSRGDGYLVHSSKDRRDLELMLDQPKVLQVEHPAYELPAQEWCSREQARSELGVEGDVLLFFGFVRPYKGLHVLLEAMQIVLRERPCTLLIAGEIWGDRQVYLDKVNSLGLAGQVRFSRTYVPQEQVARYFGASDLVVLPYLSATGSGVVKLAYSYHRPVLVSKVGSLPDAVIAGRTGYVVEPGQVEVLAGAILAHLQRTDRAAMEEDIAGYVGQFSWEAVIHAVESF